MTTDKLNLYQRLLAVVNDAGALKKGGKTSYGDKYAYHKVDDVVEHLRPLFIQHGVAMLPSVIDRSLGPASETKSGTMQWRAESLLAITFVNVDNPDERVTINGWGEGVDTSDKGVGKAIAYALKNALLATFFLRGQPDVEEEHHEGQRRSSTAKPPARKAEQNGSPPDEKAGRKKAFRAAMQEGKWTLDADSWNAVVKQSEEEYGCDPYLASDAQHAELLLWCRGGGGWPDDYKPLSLQAGIAADIDEAMTPNTEAS